MAGKRAGLDGERSGLYMEQIRIVKEMREQDERNGRTDDSIRPRHMVWENVCGSLSSPGKGRAGEDFRCVLEELARVVEKDITIPRPPKGKWSNTGVIIGDNYSIAWRITDSQWWGVPQRRRRITLLADFGGYNAPRIVFGESKHHGSAERDNTESSVGYIGGKSRSEVQPLGKSVSGNTDKSKPKRKETSSDASGSFREADCIGFDGYNGNLTGGIASTLGVNCGFTTGRNGVIVYSVDQGGGKSACNVTEGQAPTLTCTHGGEPVVCYDSIVRRLTPSECEALQGYPKGYTDIGEWADTKGKRCKTSDAARYKALGNSIALPPWKWVLKRLCACYERDATMASLFDGIGGFPFLWEQLNGKGTCLWASEIEEFPMAVTKVRIGE